MWSSTYCKLFRLIKQSKNTKRGSTLRVFCLSKPRTVESLFALPPSGDVQGIYSLRVRTVLVPAGRNIDWQTALSQRSSPVPAERSPWTSALPCFNVFLLSRWTFRSWLTSSPTAKLPRRNTIPRYRPKDSASSSTPMGIPARPVTRSFLVVPIPIFSPWYPRDMPDGGTETTASTSYTPIK